MHVITSLLCACWILFLLLLPSSNSLILYLYNESDPTSVSQFSPKYTYTSLGNPPKELPLRSKLVFLAAYNFSSDCGFAQSTNLQDIRGSIVVVEELPKDWYGCIHDIHGFPPGIGRIVQEVGGLGVIITAMEKVLHLRIIDISSNLSCLILVISALSYNYVALPLRHLYSLVIYITSFTTNLSLSFSSADP